MYDYVISHVQNNTGKRSLLCFFSFFPMPNAANVLQMSFLRLTAANVLQMSFLRLTAANVLQMSFFKADCSKCLTDVFFQG